jgi:hypothetical protein
MEAFLSLPKRGLEVGGVLYGRELPEGTQIEGFEEAPCEHRYGPSYSLSPTDREQLSAMLEQSQKGRTPIVGFFRSFVSREPEIEAADEEFVRQHFPTGEFLFLLLHPQSVEHCSASIKVFRNGVAVDGEFPTFAFDPAAMRTVEPQVPQPPPPEPMPAPEPDQPEPPDDPTAVAAFEAPRLPPPYRLREEVRPQPRVRWWLLLAASVVFGVVGAVALQLWQLAREPRWVPLRLDAKVADRGLLVTWDPSVIGDRAVLTIDDGGARREVNLTPEQMRGGNFAYTPAHTDVAFRLTLYAKGRGVSGDAVRVASVVERIQPAPAAPQPQGPTPRSPHPPTPPQARARVTIPPTPVREVQPVVSEGIRSRIRGQISIPVRVQVDAGGRVAAAAAEGRQRDGLHRYLAELAEKAARQWRFTPGKSPQGTAVAASKTVTFVFLP